MVQTSEDPKPAMRDVDPLLRFMFLVFKSMDEDIVQKFLGTLHIFLVEKSMQVNLETKMTHLGEKREFLELQLSIHGGSRRNRET